MKKLILKGNPRSTQTCYRHTCRGKFAGVYMTPECKSLKEDYQWQAKSQWKDKPLTGDLSITIVIYFGTKRKADWDNFHKLSMDSLTGIVFEDDSQIVDAQVVKSYSKEDPRIEIVIL